MKIAEAIVFANDILTTSVKFIPNALSFSLLALRENISESSLLIYFVQSPRILAENPPLGLIGQIAPFLEALHALRNMIGSREMRKVGREDKSPIAQQLRGEG